MTPRFWVGVVSKEHVLRGVEGGFAQLCHGKRAPLARMQPGDWLVYYSPRSAFRGGAPCQSFTALGSVVEDSVYAFDMGGGFVPFRRAVRFLPCHDAPIRPLLDRLSFLPDRQHWGAPFRRGHFEIPAEDFRCIVEAMGATMNSFPAGEV